MIKKEIIHTEVFLRTPVVQQQRRHLHEVEKIYD